MRSPPRLDALFQPGLRHRWPDRGESVLEVVHVADLTLATGRLVVRDHGYLALPPFDCEAFTTPVAPGRYGVALSLVRWSDAPPDMAARCAAVMVSIRAEPVLSWEPALLPGQDPSSLDDEEFFGYGVDGGQACVLDVATMPFLAQLQDTGAVMEIAEEVIKNQYAVATDVESGLNVVFFDCGMGDGVYATWLGRTRSGEVACFVTDFELLDRAQPASG